MYSVPSSLTSSTASRNKSLLSAADRDYLSHERKLELDWIYANCGSADIPKASILLGYNAKSDGIFFYSDDLEQLQFRPHTPWASKNGELPKYRTPKDEYDAFLAKHPEIEGYWRDLDALRARCFTINGKPYLLITEGCIKAITGCMWGIPTVGLMGVTMGLTPKSKGKPDLVPVLKRLAEAGFGFIIAFDSDIKPESVAGVAQAEARLTKVLKSYGCGVLSVTGAWNHEDGKGMDDFINNKEIEAFRAILMKAESHEAETRDTGDDEPTGKSKLAKMLDLVENHWGQRLRLNEMTQQIELNGKAYSGIERAYLRLGKELGVNIPKQTAFDIVVEVAEKYAYSPVYDYLNSLENVEPINLDTLAERYFGTSDPFHAILLKRTLIAAVARVFKPGCKVDTLCILQGDQGALKSTFWQTLASEPWFTDNLNDANEKDEKLKLRRYWMLEFSEFENTYKRKDINQLKSFLSSRIDSLRKPYGKVIEDFPRTSVFVGSTNSQEILNDPTGGRRMWIIPVTQTVPIKTVEAERDRIWAAAVQLYRAGEQWWLTSEEDKLLAEANQGWQSSDSWEEDILKYLELRSTCTIGDILEKPLGIDIGKHGKGEQMRVSDILRRNGWVKSKQKRIDGKIQRYWEKVITGDDGVVTEVVTPSKPCHITTLDTLSPPVTTFSQNNSQDASSDAEVSESEKPQTEKSFEDRGSDTVSSSPQNLSQQDSPPVTTSPKQGGDTPKTAQCIETHANERRGKNLANEMREAIAEGDREKAKEIMGRVDSAVLQVRGFFKQALTEDEKISIDLLKHFGLVVGVAMESDEYPGEKLTLANINISSFGQVTLACLRPDGYLTTWLKPSKLRQL
jgi:predicted P-loop ATPase